MQVGTGKRLGLEAIGLAPTMGCVVAAGLLGWDLRRNQKRAVVMSTGVAVMARDKHTSNHEVRLTTMKMLYYVPKMPQPACTVHKKVWARQKALMR